MRVLLYIFLSFFLFSCKGEDKAVSDSKSIEVEESFEMYEMSELAALMEQMYVDNQRLKEKIIKGDTIGQFPQHFLRIHESAMTNKQKRDTFFKEQAKIFIDSQELIYKDPKNAKEHFNRGVDACIACHQKKCTGPIPRIKKLYIGEIPKS